MLQLLQAEGSPYLSVVAASRNDNHGGDPLIRTQIFINNLARQCDKFQLPAELIIVDWNPVANRPGLAAVLDLPTDVKYLRARVITVPNAFHQRLKYSQQLPLFQMIAKNVGIRRAKGQFVLATNIDIIFADELMRFIGKRKLDANRLYRVDRYDIRSGLTKDLTLEETLQYAWANPIRANRRYQPEKLIQHLYGDDVFKRVCIPDINFRGRQDGVEVVEEDEVWQIRPEPSVNMSHLHTNACGDFTLLSREAWQTIRGYPEFASYSFNIDSIGVVAAHYAGYHEVSLLPPCVCFHIEHGIGSGWTPEGERQLFNRLREAEILKPEWPVLMPFVDEMRATGRALEFNHEQWGIAAHDLPEQIMGETDEIPTEKLAHLDSQIATCAISAIQPTYDLDRLTLAYERRLTSDQCVGLFAPAAAASSEIRSSTLGSTIGANSEKVILYIPDSEGRYSEGMSLARDVQLISRTTLIFRLGKFAAQFPLRFDPCQCPGFIRIDSISAFDADTQKIIWQLDGRDYRKVQASGTAVITNDELLRKRGSKRLLFSRNGSTGRNSLDIISTGADPQLILPPMSMDVGFPLILSIEMKFTPFN